MSIIKRMLKQTAIYWAPNGTDSFGKPKFLTPVQISVRWEDGLIERTADAETEVEESGAQVYVGQDVQVRGRLILGALTSGSNTDPHQAGTWEIRRFTKLPNFRATEFLRTAFLVPT